MTRRKSKSDRHPFENSPAGGNPDIRTRDAGKLQEIMDRANDSERYGFKFGLFPIWVQSYDLSNEETARLIAMAQESE